MMLSVCNVLLDICTSSLVKYLFKYFVHLKNWAVFLVDYEVFKNIFQIKVLCYIYILQIFSPRL